MDIKILLVLIFMLCVSCDPQNDHIFRVENQTNEIINLTLYHHKGSKNSRIEYTETNLYPFSDIVILQFESLHGGFGAISDFDSILFEKSDSTHLIFIRPENRYGYIDTTYVPIRDTVPHDIFNIANWKYESGVDNRNETWTYTLTSADLVLFK